MTNFLISMSLIEIQQSHEILQQSHFEEWAQSHNAIFLRSYEIKKMRYHEIIIRSQEKIDCEILKEISL